MTIVEEITCSNDLPLRIGIVAGCAIADNRCAVGLPFVYAAIADVLKKDV